MQLTGTAETGTSAAQLRSLVDRLGKRHAHRDIRAALIQSWLASNTAVAARQLAGCPTITQVLEEAHRAQSQRALETVQRHGPVRSLKQLEMAFESLVSAERRRRHGVVYTPDFIIDYLLHHAIDFASADSLTQPQKRLPVVCDPACGSGGFLVRAARLLSHRWGLPAGRVIQESIVGCDQDAGSILQARCLLELAAASWGDPLGSRAARLLCSDTLLAGPERFLETAGVASGLDVLVSNPPYVKLQNLTLSYRAHLAQRYADFLKGSFSLAPLFLLVGHQLLAPGGCLGFITQNNLFTSLAGEPIRRYLQQTKSIRRIVDFKHNRIFPQASAYTCLLFLGAGPRDDFDFDALDGPIDGHSLHKASFEKIQFDRLTPRKWRLAKGRHLDNLARIEQVGAPLGQVAAIRVGFATLKDAAYFAQQTNHGCLARSPEGEAREIEPQITRPAIKISNFDNEQQIKDNDACLIFPYRAQAGRYQIIPEAELRQRFPRAYDHLRDWRDVLHKRDKGRRRLEAWYAWGRAQGRQAPGPKLLTRTFDSRPRFMLDESDSLFCNGYAVSLPGRSPVRCDLPIRALQRILNSVVMHYYAKLTSFHIRGGYPCYQKNFIEKFGIPHLTDKQLEELLGLADRDVDPWLMSLYRLLPDDIRDGVQ